MCGRFAIFQTEHLSERFNLATHPLLHLADNYNLAPGQTAMVITRHLAGNQLELMKWGIVPHWAKDLKGRQLINTRAEGCLDKPMWRDMVLQQRCLVPARGFYEWQSADGKKQPFYVRPKGRSLFSFAGLWSISKDVEGREIKAFSIITTGANREMSEVHNRMPVILEPDEESLWLESACLSEKQIHNLLKPYKDDGLELYEVSPDVNKTAQNDKHLIERL